MKGIKKSKSKELFEEDFLDEKEGKMEPQQKEGFETIAMEHESIEHDKL